MESITFIIGLLIITALACGLIWSIWPFVIAVLALIGLAQLVRVWQNQSGLRM